MAKQYFVQDGISEAGSEILNAFRLLPDELLAELEKLPRTVKKCLVIDSSLIVPLDIMLKKTDLHVFNIEKVFFLEGKDIPYEWKYIFYLVPSTIEAVRKITSHIKKDRSLSIERWYTIGFVPKRNAAVETFLENEGCHSHRIRLTDFKLSCIPLDLDLVTLNCPQMFKSVFLDKDNEYLEVFADSFLRVLTKLGITWPEIRGRLVVGEMSQKVVKLLDSGVIKPTGDTYSKNISINHTVTMALMDRDSDFISPLLSQVIFEGRVDDHIGIDLGKVSIDKSALNEENNVTMNLDWKDPVFADLRHLNPNAVGCEIRKKTVENREASDTGRLKTVTQMSRFVREDLKDLKTQSLLLNRHVVLAEQIGKDTKEQVRVITHERTLLDCSAEGCMEFLEEQLSLREGLISSMRLMALWCVTHDGMPNAMYDSLVQLTCQSYGYDCVLAFYNLKRVGLLYPKRDRSLQTPQVKSFSQLKKYLELVNPEQINSGDSVHKSGASYVFMGYHTPVISMLVERVFARSNQFKDVWFSGIPLTHLKYQPPVRFRGRQVIIIGFLGGCTLSEVNSLRLLAQYYKIQIVVVTSCILNFNSLINQMQHDE